MQSETPANDFDARLSRLDGAVEQLDKRMGSIEIRMSNLEVRVDTGFRDVNARLDKLLRWINRIQIAVLIALGTLILVKL